MAWHDPSMNRTPCINCVDRLPFFRLGVGDCGWGMAGGGVQFFKVTLVGAAVTIGGFEVSSRALRKCGYIPLSRCRRRPPVSYKKIQGEHGMWGLFTRTIHARKRRRPWFHVTVSSTTVATTAIVFCLFSIYQNNDQNCWHLEPRE